MPNPEHLEIFKQGIEAWNRWRSENPELRPDLGDTIFTGHHFSGADLRRTDFARTVFNRCYLNDADLSEANLPDTRLIGSILSDAILRGTILRDAVVEGCTLENADMRESWLFGTYFRDSHLCGANLKGAHLQEAVFNDTNLKGAVGLDSCAHSSPSVLDLRTIAKSGDLPLTFLRGCGLPESLIDYLPSMLAANPIEFYSCFVSYSTKDQDFAERLYADLQNAGVRCWFYPQDMKIGDRIRPSIDQAIRVRDKLLLVLSEPSISSSWVEKEVETAFEEERKRGQSVLFPIRLDDAVMETNEAWAADLRRMRHIGDFRKWKEHDAYRKAFDRLLRDLRAAKVPANATRR